MNHFLFDCKFLSLIDILKHSIKNSRNSILLRRESNIVLVCGGKNDDKKTDVAKSVTMRQIMMDYGKRNLKQYKFLQAEEVFINALKDDPNKNLLVIEEEISRFTDCIILILESPGAIAEIGAFASIAAIYELVFVVNNIEFINESSFITLGPLAQINRYSKFKPTLYAEFSESGFVNKLHIIEERLKNTIKMGKRRRSPDISTFKLFESDSSKKIRLFLISDLISLFSPIKKDELDFILSYIYGISKRNRFNLGVDIGILEALDLVDSQDDYYFSKEYKDSNFLDIRNVNFIDERAHVINMYHKYSRQRVDLLHGRAIQSKIS